MFHKKITKLYGCNRFHSHLQTNMLNSYMDVNFNKYSNYSFLTVVYTVFVSNKSHMQVLNRPSKAGQL